ncbi:MAG: DUF711 family protein [Acidilobus sp.]
MVGFELRAVTLHVGTLNHGEGSLDGLLDDIAFRALEAVDKASAVTGLRPTYVRVAMPELRAEHARSLSAVAERLGGDVLINGGQVPASADLRPFSDLPAAGVYFSILMTSRSWEEARRASEFIHSLSSSDPSLATKVAVNALGEKSYITPYYPLASAIPGRDIVTTALTYPSYLLDAFGKGGIEGLSKAASRAGSEAVRFAEEAARALGFEVGGVDLSVSPWMDDSTLALVEVISGVRMPRAGFTNGVRAVNEAIARASADLKTTGFNEVMLPVAEDSKLKARASEGDVTARYLAMLSGVCVTGLDMVAVPASVNDVAGLILDVASYASAKGRTLGVRVIPVEGAEPGDKVDLGRFGEAPIISI